MLIRQLTASFIVLALSSGIALAKGGHGPHGPGAGTSKGTGSVPMMMSQPPATDSALDTNGDGRITWTEIKAARTAEFTALDTNADGYASFQELQAGQEKQQADTFAKRDADQTGTLSVTEFAGTGTDGKTAVNTKVFGLTDTDKDSTLSPAEYAALDPVFPHAVRLFSMMDEDDDNQVSQDEYLMPQLPMGDRRGMGF